MRAIPQRELRNDVSGVLRDVAAGEAVEVTVRGKTVAELHPPRNRRLVPRARALAVLRPATSDTWLKDVLADREQDEADERGVA